jgi:hypothetical protein
MIGKHGVDLSHFAQKVHAWAVDESRRRGRDVTFHEVFSRWLTYVHPQPERIARETSMREFPQGGIR